MNTPKRSASLLFVASLVAISFGLWRAGPAAQAAPAPDQPAVTSWLFLPLVQRSSAIYGRVTQAEATPAGLSMRLRLFSNGTWSTLLTAVTDGSGHYQFANPPALIAGQKYQVVYENSDKVAGRLLWWGTAELTSFGGNEVDLGSFDIADVALTAPGADAFAGLPVGFQWQRRPASPSDSYALRLYGRDYNPVFETGGLGYVSDYSLANLPPSFSLGTLYAWEVVVRSPDGGSGVSWSRGVRPGAGLFGRVSQNGASASAVLLELRYFSGLSWSTVATTTTSVDGVYLFTNVPSLGAGQRYYVRYQNAAQTAGRLFLWSTRSLTAYANASSLAAGDFDISDVALVVPPAGAAVSLPYSFQWTRRPSTPSESYILEVYDPADFQPRWLSPLLGYAETYNMAGLAPVLYTNTPYAWDVVIVSPDGGSGLSRVARWVSFTNRGAFLLLEPSANWPFDEEVPVRPAEGLTEATDPDTED